MKELPEIKDQLGLSGWKPVNKEKFTEGLALLHMEDDLNPVQEYVDLPGGTTAMVFAEQTPYGLFGRLLMLVHHESQDYVTFESRLSVDDLLVAD